MALFVSALIGCGIQEPEFWFTGFVNDSDSNFILDDGRFGPFVMPAHTQARVPNAFYPDQTNAATVLDTDCRAVASVTLKIHANFVHVDDAGRVGAANADVESTASPPATTVEDVADLLMGGRCLPGWWHVDARNDSDSSYFLAVDGGGRPVYLPAHTRGNVAGSEQGEVPASATLYDTNCVQLASVKVPGDGTVIHVDASGRLSAQPQSALWAPSPVAGFRGYWNHTDAPTCPSLAPSPSVN